LAYDETIAIRIRAHLKMFSENFEEKTMFGGLSFLYQSKMTVGIVKNELTVRIIDSKMDDELKKKHVRPMDFTKRPMKEFVYVAKEGFNTEAQLLHYIELGLEHAKSKL